MRRTRPRRPITATIAAAALLAAGAATAGAAAPADPTLPAAPAENGRAVTVTLVTGDVVDARVAAGGRVLSAAPRPVAGADHPAAVWQDGERTYVFPSGVEDLVDAGLVDPELFDIGTLVADGYDDASTGTVPVIVEYAGGPAARAAVPGVSTTSALGSIGGAGLAVAKKDAADAWQALVPSAGRRARSAGGVTRIWLDAKVHGSAVTDLPGPTVPLTGATTAHRAGLDGSGVKVAVLDTGVDAGHPDLAGRITETKVFVRGADSADRTGHGTHTASTIAGTGAASGGRYAGMAPGADLLVGKVLGDDGSGTTSDIIAGMQWAVDEGASVVSMSLGADGSSSCTGPDVDAVQNLSDRALFVIAAGNAGVRRSVSTPGCAPAALTVGALDRDGRTASFSSRGPSVDGRSAKPDIASQGVDVVAARAGGRGDLAYQEMSGTSMATPHVAGGAALLFQQHPGYSPAQVKALLTSSAAATGVPVLEQGAGPMDVARAVAQPVVGDAQPLLGDFAYPQQDLAPVTEPVTLTNLTADAVTLTVGVTDVRGDDGSRLAGFARTGLPRVTVPAHGTADVPVVLDPGARLDSGDYGTVTGRLVATGARGVRVTVPFGAYLEPPSANLTVKGVDRHGDGAASPSTFQLFDDHRDTAKRYTLGYPAAGATTIRVPLGTYSLSGLIMTRDTAGNIGDVASVTQLYDPRVTVRGDTTVTLDARDAARISWRTDRPAQAQGYAVGLAVALDDARERKASYVESVPSYVKEIYAQKVPHAPDLTFLASVRETAPLAALTTGGGRTLDTLPVQMGTEFDGRGSAEVVPIGSGSDAAFAAADLRGKIALVDAGAGGGNGYTWQAAAAKAGAVGVLAAVPGTQGRFQVTGGAGVPQATITWDDSLALKAEAAASVTGTATVSWSGTASAMSPYLYNLATTSQNAIRPGEIRVRDKDLSRSDARYHVQNASDTTYWSDVEVGLPGIASTWAGGTTLQLHAPQERTEYFTPSGDSGLVWTTLMRRDLSQYGSTGYDGPHAFAAGSSTAEWYKSPYGPVRNTYSPPLMTRDSDRLTFTMAPFGDAGGHDNTLGSTDQGTRRLLIDGVPQLSTAGVFTLPQAMTELTFDQNWQRPATAADRVGLAYDTVWTFRSGAQTQGAQRLLVPEVDVPSDLRNARPAGQPTTIGLAAVVDGTAGAVALDDVRMEYAYGSATTTAAVTGWRTATVRQVHGTWQATLPGDAPAGAFVHLRVTLADSQGSAVTQTMVRAYEVR
ncbi:S8 family serine peptidase [Streptomyces sp. NRRL F-5123]|uniref:S8 family serine peptidase n=1 Tax=Streptomyces sp. NRRL F-5123 TaxID=1463856 RepID=UPI0005B7EBB7|nr:S8 family serine peptidase [Streptomyces sp. NRRL F-5123]